MRPILQVLFLLLALVGLAYCQNDTEVESSITCLTDNGAQVVLLDENNNLIVFTPGVRSAQIFKVTGLNGTLLEIDFRTSNGALYGLNSRQQVFQIDLSTGVATLASNLSHTEFKDNQVNLDFDRVSDQLRLITRSKSNFRLDVDIKNGSNALTQDDNIQHTENRRIQGIAYSVNSTTGNSTLYAIDRRRNRGGRARLLIIEDPISNATVVPQARLELASNAPLDGFDIFNGNGCDVSVICQDDKFYELDLVNGTVSQVWKSTTKWLNNVFKLDVIDLAFVTISSTPPV